MLERFGSHLIILYSLALVLSPNCLLANWEVLSGVKLISSSSNDGDSIRATHQGREYIFRLYGADCPETDMSFPDRVMSQASEFGVSTDEALEWGHAASRRTSQVLSSPFRVVTRWDNALGRSNLPRHYAYILPASGGDLAASLLSEGLARAKGNVPRPPEGFVRVGSSSEYQQFQSGAKSGKRGIWGQSRPSSATLRSPDHAPQTAYGKNSTSGSKSSKVNINTAPLDQLESLPGIGPVLAERIIANRPYYKESDLIRVPGIGPEKLRQIMALVIVRR